MKWAAKIQLIVTDPPYNVLEHEYDKISDVQMELLVRFAKDLLKNEGTIVIMCSFLQWHKYYEYAKKYSMYPDPSPYFIIKFPEHRRPTSERRYTTNQVACVALVAHKKYNHYWNATGKSEFNQGRFHKVDNVMEDYHYESNKLKVDDVAIRHEQKGTDIFKFFIDNYSKKGDIIMDPFVGTGTCIAAGLEMGRRIYASELDPICYGHASNRINECVYQMLDPKRKASRSTKNKDKEETEDTEIEIPDNNYPDYVTGLKKHYPNLDISNLASLFCQLDQVEVKECSALSEITGADELGLFAAREFKKDEIIGYYYGDILTEEMKEERYNSMTKNSTRIFAIKPPSLKKRIYIDGALYCPVTFINDYRNLAPSPNCYYTTTNGDIEGEPFEYCVKAMKNINKDEEFLLYYGDEFNFCDATPIQSTARGNEAEAGEDDDEHIEEETKEKEGEIGNVEEEEKIAETGGKAKDAEDEEETKDKDAPIESEDEGNIYY